MPSRTSDTHAIEELHPLDAGDVDFDAAAVLAHLCESRHGCSGQGGLPARLPPLWPRMLHLLFLGATEDMVNPPERHGNPQSDAERAEVRETARIARRVCRSGQRHLHLPAVRYVGLTMPTAVADARDPAAAETAAALAHVLSTMRDATAATTIAQSSAMDVAAKLANRAVTAMLSDPTLGRTVALQLAHYAATASEWGSADCDFVQRALHFVRTVLMHDATVVDALAPPPVGESIATMLANPRTPTSVALDVLQLAREIGEWGMRGSLPVADLAVKLRAFMPVFYAAAAYHTKNAPWDRLQTRAHAATFLEQVLHHPESRTVVASTQPGELDRIRLARDAWNGGSPVCGVNVNTAMAIYSRTIVGSSTTAEGLGHLMDRHDLGALLNDFFFHARAPVDVRLDGCQLLVDALMLSPSLTSRLLSSPSTVAFVRELYRDDTKGFHEVRKQLTLGIFRAAADSTSDDARALASLTTPQCVIEHAADFFFVCEEKSIEKFDEATARTATGVQRLLEAVSELRDFVSKSPLGEAIDRATAAGALKLDSYTAKRSDGGDDGEACSDQAPTEHLTAVIDSARELSKLFPQRDWVDGVVNTIARAGDAGSDADDISAALWTVRNAAPVFGTPVEAAVRERLLAAGVIGAIGTLLRSPNVLRFNKAEACASLEALAQSCRPPISAAAAEELVKIAAALVTTLDEDEGAGDLATGISAAAKHHDAECCKTLVELLEVRSLAAAWRADRLSNGPAVSFSLGCAFESLCQHSQTTLAETLSGPEECADAIAAEGRVAAARQRSPSANDADTTASPARPRNGAAGRAVSAALSARLDNHTEEEQFCSTIHSSW